MLKTQLLNKLVDTRTSLLFPIETFSRELDFRLALGMIMAQRGHRVLVGSENAFYRLMQLDLITGSTYMGKLFSPYFTSDKSVYNFYKSRDMRFIHLDEEGAVFPGEHEAFDQQLATRVEPCVLDPEDYMFTWGTYQRDFYRSQEPACKDHIIATGHPRFDLYKPDYVDFYEEAASGYRERYGDFILMNSNLASVNSSRHGIAFFFSDATGILRRADHYSDVTPRWRDCMEQICDFIELTYALSERYPERHIVIRPHPSEDHYLYQQAFMHHDNVHVVYENSVGPWLAACGAMVHYNCTTAIEAHLMQKPVINFRKHQEDLFVNYLPNSFGKRCYTEQDVFDVLDTYGKDPESFEFSEVQPRAQSLLHNLGHDSMNGVAEHLDAVLKEHLGPKRSPSIAALDIVEKARYTASSSKRRVMRKLSTREVGPMFNQKFEGFRMNKLMPKFEALQRVLPLSSEVSLTLHSPFLFSLEVPA